MISARTHWHWIGVVVIAAAAQAVVRAGTENAVAMGAPTVQISAGSTGPHRGALSPATADS